MADTIITDADVIKALRKRVALNGLRATAREVMFSAPFLSDVIAKRRALSPRLGVALGFAPMPERPMPKRIRRWKYLIGNSVTSEWERKNYPQKAK